MNVFNPNLYKNVHFHLGIDFKSQKLHHLYEILTQSQFQVKWNNVRCYSLYSDALCNCLARFEQIRFENPWPRPMCDKYTYKLPPHCESMCAVQVDSSD